jgi:hypothetical protein
MSVVLDYELIPKNISWNSLTNRVNRSTISLTELVNGVVGGFLSGKINKTQDIYNGGYEA